jgi:hypothetical protein
MKKTYENIRTFCDQLSNNKFTKKGCMSLVPCTIRQNPCFAWKFKMVFQSATDMKRFGKDWITVWDISVKFVWSKRGKQINKTSSMNEQNIPLMLMLRYLLLVLPH